jgi:hypothetical protein
MRFIAMNHLYSYVSFSKWDFGPFRLLGSGLGNLLFPWARFVLGSKQHNLEAVAPTWATLKLGPLLRRELDARFYLGLFRPSPHQVAGWRKLWLLATAHRVDEAQLSELPRPAVSRGGTNRLIVFEGIRDGFSSLPRAASPVLDELQRITIERHRGDLRYRPSRCISMHVRLGDFRDISLVTPVPWFVGIAKGLRQELGQDWPIHIFSDGTDEELAPLLSLPDSRHVSFGSSVADLLAMSRANVLIASRLSTFNMWSFYLGRMPVIWPPDTVRWGLEQINPELQFLLTSDDRIPQAAIMAAQRQN